MTKLIRRTATMGVSAVLTGAALLAVGGSAVAAPDHLDARTPAHAAVVVDAEAHTAHHKHGATRPDPWIAGQLTMADPWIADQLTMADPWIADQLALFTARA
ncbi:hypothetical protein AB0N17_04115 [Streptomyces sp. NPDC051133]|uniref:hypothetical protein n=1 Tax=Streptomyces sp. NPDC051133 TaxID=3155521 RepID=UPI00341ECA24